MQRLFRNEIRDAEHRAWSTVLFRGGTGIGIDGERREGPKMGGLHCRKGERAITVNINVLSTFVDLRLRLCYRFNLKVRSDKASYMQGSKYQNIKTSKGQRVKKSKVRFFKFVRCSY